MDLIPEILTINRPRGEARYRQPRWYMRARTPNAPPRDMALDVTLIRIDITIFSIFPVPSIFAATSGEKVIAVKI